MLSLEVTYLVYQEQKKDYLREVEQGQLLRIALSARSKENRVHKRALAWLGSQLVKYGARLEQYGSAAASKAVSLKT